MYTYSCRSPSFISTVNISSWLKHINITIRSRRTMKSGCIENTCLDCSRPLPSLHREQRQQCELHFHHREWSWVNTCRTLNPTHEDIHFDPLQSNPPSWRNYWWRKCMYSHLIRMQRHRIDWGWTRVISLWSWSSTKYHRRYIKIDGMSCYRRSHILIDPSSDPVNIHFPCFWKPSEVTLPLCPS